MNLFLDDLLDAGLFDLWYFDEVSLLALKDVPELIDVVFDNEAYKLGDFCIHALELFVRTLFKSSKGQSQEAKVHLRIVLET